MVWQVDTDWWTWRAIKNTSNWQDVLTVETTPPCCYTWVWQLSSDSKVPCVVTSGPLFTCKAPQSKNWTSSICLEWCNLTLIDTHTLLKHTMTPNVNDCIFHNILSMSLPADYHNKVFLCISSFTFFAVAVVVAEIYCHPHGQRLHAAHTWRVWGKRLFTQGDKRKTFETIKKKGMCDLIHVEKKLYILNEWSCPEEIQPLLLSSSLPWCEWLTHLFSLCVYTFLVSSFCVNDVLQFCLLFVYLGLLCLWSYLFGGTSKLLWHALK